MNKDELQVGDLVTGRPLPGIVRDHPSIGLVIHSATYELTRESRTYYSVLWFGGARKSWRGNPEACKNDEVTKLEIPNE
jgi:hypothetical protein